MAVKWMSKKGFIHSEFPVVLMISLINNVTGLGKDKAFFCQTIPTAIFPNGA